MDSNKDLLSQFEAAFLEGPPQEICMVLEDNRLRPFNKYEDDLIGTRVVSSDHEGPSTLPLYGVPRSGWRLELED